MTAETVPTPNASQTSGALGTFWVGDSGAKLTVLRAVAPILIGFASDFHDSVETLDPADCHGDSHGDGIHLNCTKHETRATFTTRQIMTVGRLMDKWSLAGRSLLYWGSFDSEPNPAYFRLDVAREIWEPALALLQQPIPPGVTPTPVVPYAGAVGSRTVRLRTPRMYGQDVQFIRQVLFKTDHRNERGTDRDDEYGPCTEQSVCSFQSSQGLEIDGIVGPATWAALLG